MFPRENGVQYALLDTKILDQFVWPKRLEIVLDRLRTSIARRKLLIFRLVNSPYTVKSHVKALSLYNFIRGFGWAYKRGSLYRGGGGGANRENITSLLTNTKAYIGGGLITGEGFNVGFYGIMFF